MKKFFIFSLILFCIFFTDGLIMRHSENGIERHYNEHKIYSRLIKSRENGIFSAGGLLGEYLKEYGTPTMNNTMPKQFMDYRNHKDRGYRLYYLQSGSQGLIFSLVDKIAGSPFIFKGVASLLLALILAWWLMWINAEFGSFISWVSFGFIVFNRWLVILGTNLFYLFAFSYLPIVALFWAYKKKIKHIGLIAFITLSLNFLISGFKFLPVLITMPFIPLLFYARKMQRKEAIYRFFQLLRSVLLAFCFTMSILLLQIPTKSKGSENVFDKIASAKKIFEQNIIKRVSVDFDFNYIKLVAPNPIVPHSTKELLQKQLSIVHFDIWGLKIALWGFILLVALASFFVKDKNSIFITWLSILCPLSWILLMRGQVAVHCQVDSIVWDMPFILMGAILIGEMLCVLIKKYYLF